MGWWSTDIMGGDSPLDWEDLMFDVCNVNKFPEGGGIATIPKKEIEENLPKILEKIKPLKYASDFQIAYQVLAVTMLKVGATIPDDVKADMIKACDEDEWAKEDDSRRTATQNLKTALESYTGKPMVIKSKGLFEVIGEHLAAGKTGLVNI